MPSVWHDESCQYHSSQSIAPYFGCANGFFRYNSKRTNFVTFLHRHKYSWSNITHEFTANIEHILSGRCKLIQLDRNSTNSSVFFFVRFVWIIVPFLICNKMQCRHCIVIHFHVLQITKTYLVWIWNNTLTVTKTEFRWSKSPRFPRGGVNFVCLCVRVCQRHVCFYECKKWVSFEDQSTVDCVYVEMSGNQNTNWISNTGICI